jgi:uncharacterized protein (DUF885 family)
VSQPGLRSAAAVLAVALVCAAVVAFHATAAHAQAPTGVSAAAQANALFDEYWQTVLSEAPEFATFLGDHRYDDRLSDVSDQAVARRRAGRAEFRERAARIDAAALPDAERISLAVLRYRLDQLAAEDALYGSLPFGAFDPWAPVTQQNGPHLDFERLVRATRFASVRDYENYLKRLDAVPSRLDGLIARMERAIAAGWTPPRVAIERVPQQIDAQIDDDPTRTPGYVPFAAFPPDMPAAERERLAAAGRRAIGDGVVPAFRRLKTFYSVRYIPAARASVGASELPAGRKYYELMLARNTTTAMTAREIHELGLAEVARIGKSMDAVAKEAGFAGTRAQFQAYLNSEPRFFYSSAADLLAGYRDIAKRADAEMPRLFATLPRQTYGIRAMLPQEGNNAERYTRGAADGSRPGWFEANANDLATRPKWRMEALLLHEGVPGHHLQIARAQELAALPAFRRGGGETAYTEGWALYAESLGYEIGFYADPHSHFGALSLEMHRACRLVVDTGLHAFGWSKEKAVAYLVEHAALTRAFAEAEVDRYVVWPGQAAAYKIGELRIKALRAKAKDALGERFDLRRFHNAVVDTGAVPLDVLAERIDAWIAREKAGF